MMGATDATTQLVQLGEPKVVRALNNDGIRRGNIDAGFDNRRTDQHVKPFVVKVRHDLFELALTHLSMSEGNARFGN